MKWCEQFAGRIQRWWRKWCTLGMATRVDLVSRVVFPCSFILFLMIYWIYYVKRSGYENYRNIET